MRRELEEIFNEGKLELADELLSSDYTVRDQGSRGLRARLPSAPRTAHRLVPANGSISLPPSGVVARRRPS